MKIIDRIKKQIKEINECENVEPSYDLKIDIGLDSLSLVSLIVGLENEFGIQFDDSDLDPSKLLTVEDIITLVEKYL